LLLSACQKISNVSDFIEFLRDVTVGGVYVLLVFMY